MSYIISANIPVPNKQTLYLAALNGNSHPIWVPNIHDAMVVLSDHIAAEYINWMFAVANEDLHMHTYLYGTASWFQLAKLRLLKQYPIADSISLVRLTPVPIQTTSLITGKRLTENR